MPSVEPRFKVGASGAPAKAAAAALEFGVEREPAAIFIAHGMGQQVPFDTLTSVACGLLGGAAQGQARSIDIGTQRVQRLEMTVKGRPVHVYEGYWAPLTEGSVGIKDVIRFLFSGATNGIGAATGAGFFERHVGGVLRQFKIPASTVASLLSAILVVCSLIVMNAVIGAVLAMRFTFGGPGWVNDVMLRDLTTAFEAVLIAAAIAGAMLLISMKAKGAARRALIVPINILLLLAGALIVVTGLVAVPVILAQDRGHDAVPLLPVLPDRLFIVLVAVAVAGALLYGAYKTVRFLLRADKGWWLAALVILVCVALAAALVAGILRAPDFGIGTDSLAVFGLLALLSGFIRWFLIEFVGDVAAYVQPHKVDRFFALRDSIKNIVYDRMRAVYDCAAPRYEHVIVVGHSLGSVVVYDALNRLINDDLIANAGRDVVARTPLLLTFGSPLDKTAFFFHINSTPRDVDAKEALAATMQPILDGHRPCRWANVWSPQDILGGPLDYYGAVRNLADRQASTPLAAHVQYWDNKLIYRIIRLYL
jgi:hypothetical protein